MMNSFKVSSYSLPLECDEAALEDGEREREEGREVRDEVCVQLGYQRRQAQQCAAQHRVVGVRQATERKNKKKTK